FYPEWVERFELVNGELPKVNTDLSTTTLQRVGQQVTTQFRRYNVPFSPYDLRHAWAVRTILMGLPDAVAARMMGHSVQVHNRTYHRWMTHRDQQTAVQAALAKNEMKAPM
ncbi:MAG: site-specific integrase, partial [Cyanobacteria bacterium J06633_23]